MYVVKSIRPTRYEALADAPVGSLFAAEAVADSRREDAVKAHRTETIIVVDENGRTVKRHNVWLPTRPAQEIKVNFL